MLQSGFYVWDPFSGNKHGLESAVPNNTQIHTNDINVSSVSDTHLDATEFDYYHTFLLNHGFNGIIVTSMPFSFCDVVIPMLASEFSNMLICLHVGPNFISDGPLPRHTYMLKLFRHGRIHVIHGTSRNYSGHRGQWLIIFPVNSDKTNYLSALTRSSMGNVTYSTV